ncbi:RNA polymerase sigma factor [Actinocrispum wychmicini]|uniref:RNA polymerase sigma-70 factor (ECF subfamily) n=1 Tax=Actinocrispum wychmicini TaxID=1213861 RepID=A0A4R2KFN0_9PSEU|nr:sigma factor-like helix-turn-helix DNA-binding protein [Actinocrispum wychmicini]TCO65295.1 RNA polymerase sigma-70 factor (ECF subfamily) [Actinocrispum wychmicini]
MWDSDIRQRLTYGDHDALAEVYDRYGRTVYAVAMGVTLSAEVAEAVTVSTFHTLWDRPLSYDPTQATLSGWLARMAHLRSVSWLRESTSQVPSGQAVDMAYFHGLTYHQIAAKLGIPESTAKARLQAGLRGL